MRPYHIVEEHYRPYHIVEEHDSDVKRGTCSNEVSCCAAGCTKLADKFQTFRSRLVTMVYAWCPSHFLTNTPDIEDSWMCDDSMWTEITEEEYVIILVMVS